MFIFLANIIDIWRGLGSQADSPNLSPGLTSAEKSAPTLFTFSVCLPAGPGLVNLLPWFQLRGLRRDTPCLRCVVVGVGVMFNVELYLAQLSDLTQRNLQQI